MCPYGKKEPGWNSFLKGKGRGEKKPSEARKNPRNLPAASRVTSGVKRK
jgi:hypothetical protein